MINSQPASHYTTRAKTILFLVLCFCILFKIHSEMNSKGNKGWRKHTQISHLDHKSFLYLHCLSNFSLREEWLLSSRMKRVGLQNIWKKRKNGCFAASMISRNRLLYLISSCLQAMSSSTVTLGSWKLEPQNRI